MIHSVKFTCVLDTNVIYPITVRDILLWFAHYELYTPKWSKHIFDELERIMERKGVEEAHIKRRIQNINDAFPDAMVSNYEPLIEGLVLPDDKDKHVLAAAIKTNANLIVTNNLKDFPEDYLAGFGLSAKNVDDFLTDIIDLNQIRSKMAFLELVRNKRNPPLTEYDVLEQYRRIGLKDTADYLHALL